MKTESLCYSCFSLQGAFLMQLSMWEAGEFSLLFYKEGEIFE